MQIFFFEKLFLGRQVLFYLCIGRANTVWQAWSLVWVPLGAKLSSDGWLPAFFSLCFLGPAMGEIRGTVATAETLAVQMEGDSRRLPRLAGGRHPNL